MLELLRSGIFASFKTGTTVPMQQQLIHVPIKKLEHVDILMEPTNVTLKSGVDGIIHLSDSHCIRFKVGIGEGSNNFTASCLKLF